MAEIRGSFGSADEWKAWIRELGDVGEIRRAIVADIRSRGYVEPLTGVVRYPYDIVIRESDLGESISSHGLNSRKRALLVQIVLELQERNWSSKRNIRILGAEALSRTALILRGQYPFFWGTENIPDEAARLRVFPIPHMDLQEIDLPAETFDVFTGGDALEHIPDLDRTLKEILRVLKPGGVMIVYFPFEPGRLATITKMSPSAADNTINSDESVNVGNSAVAADSSIAFRLWGWDLLPKLVSVGFEDAYFSMIASSHFGIVCNSQLGVFVLTAVKSGGKPNPCRRPAGVLVKTALPEKLCTLIALPRSGTTLLTSVFAVHSKCEAVYEPWNGKRIAGDADVSIELIAKVERLPSLAEKMLFVKETAAFSGSIPGLRKLYESAPFPVDKHMLMLLRMPEHIFLSEIERRKEWWKEDVSVNAATFDNWAVKSKLALRLMFDFGMASNGTLLLLEDFAARPMEVLTQLAQRIGFSVEREQLEYEKHVDKRRVRGDLNVSGTPSKIDLGFATTRTEKVATIDRLISASAHAAWFGAFRALYGIVHANGGIVSMRDIPRSAIDDLFSAKDAAAR
jgi:SAM-dependent methyltransferase